MASTVLVDAISVSKSYRDKEIQNDVDLSTIFLRGGRGSSEAAECKPGEKVGREEER